MNTTQEDVSTLAHRFIQVRNHFNLSKRQLGKAAGISGQGWEEIESGTTLNPRMNVLVSLSDELKINLIWLSTGRGSMFEEAKEDETGLRAKLNFALDYIGKLEQKIKDMDLKMSQMNLKLALLGKTEPLVHPAGLFAGVFAPKNTPLPTVRSN
jgi:transcriptional regulator with XRE-family HTH domain